MHSKIVVCICTSCVCVCPLSLVPCIGNMGSSPAVQARLTAPGAPYAPRPHTAIAPPPAHVFAGDPGPVHAVSTGSESSGECQPLPPLAPTPVGQSISIAPVHTPVHTGVMSFCDFTTTQFESLHVGEACECTSDTLWSLDRGVSSASPLATLQSERASVSQEYCTERKTPVIPDQVMIASPGSLASNEPMTTVVDDAQCMLSIRSESDTIANDYTLTIGSPGSPQTHLRARMP
jgi:hypothetical protein